MQAPACFAAGRNAVFPAATVVVSGVDGDPDPESPLPSVGLLAKKTGASKGIEPDAESWMVWPVAAAPVIVALNFVSGMVRPK